MSTTGQHTLIQPSRGSELRIGVLCINIDPASRDGGDWDLEHKAVMRYDPETGLSLLSP